MIGALANPKASFPFLLMLALVGYVAIVLLGPIVTNVFSQIERDADAAAQERALTDPDYREQYDQLIAIPITAETQILVRTAHGSRHGDVRSCFQGPNELLYFIETSSGRVHVICKVTETDFFDLIVKDRRKVSGYIEEVTVFKVSQYPTITDFIQYLTSRVNYPCTQYLDDWLNAVIRFVFLQ